ncbi:hypothetical protein [Yoonia maritima]|uniref:hypothetical protein n=1 Tax=Yoonia maritima TaxID=1435347 RepID=UPI000D0E6875|nr:hypothetical protein [Yoonia maritima]
MNMAARKQGGAAVGQLSDQPRLEACIVLYFRMWCDGPDSQEAVWNDLSLGLGQAHGRATLKTLEQLFAICTEHRRRPLMRHAVGCSCLGADEACFANFVATATEGDREDALLIATLLVRADIAPLITSLASDLGLALKTMLMRGQPMPRAQAPAHATLH